MATVVVVDDSPFVRTLLTEIVESGGHTVVGAAGDGETALSLVREHDVDVVTMDLELSGRDGYWTLDRLMAERPTPVVVISANVHEGVANALGLMERGVVDVVRKPAGEVRPTALWQRADDICERIAGASNASTSSAAAEPSRSAATAVDATAAAPTTVVVGSSTGGPEVVERVVADLPATLDVRLLLVQHMTDRFTGSFADRLDAASEFDIREATDGRTLTAGEGVVAKGGSHLEVASYRNGRLTIELTDGPKRHNVRPAIDVTMESAAATVDDPLVGAILTGMGRDGADGVAAIGRGGGRVVAQNEATSRIFGMPGAAIETGHVDRVRPADELAAAIVDCVVGNEDERKK